MRSLSRELHRADGGGEPLPAAVPSLAAAGVNFRRSELAMLAGQPGAGKSALALILAMRTRVPTVYFSADSSSHTQMLRVLAASTGRPQWQCESEMTTRPQFCEGVLTENAGHIHWVFDSAPTRDDITDELDAYVVAMGQAPHLIIVDNLTDAVDEDNKAELLRMTKELKTVGRHYNSCLLLLHHVSEAEQYKCEPCPPRKAIQYKVSEIPALILTVASADDGGLLFVAPVKNRHGKADKSGRTAVTFQMDFDSMHFADPLDGRK